MKKIFYIILFYACFFGNTSYTKDILPITDGSINAKIKIIVYESMTCGHCGDFHKDVYPDLKKEFIDTGLANIEFRNFPLDLAALNASKIAHCQNDGDSKILHFLFNNQKNWIIGNNILEINNSLKNLLQKENITLNFEKCLSDKEIEDFILEERISGHKKFDIKSTPTLIINDKKFEKTLNFKNLKKILKKMI